MIGFHVCYSYIYTTVRFTCVPLHLLSTSVSPDSLPSPLSPAEFDALTLNSYVRHAVNPLTDACVFVVVPVLGGDESTVYLYSVILPPLDPQGSSSHA